MQTFITRQPILDSNKNAYAYELLYRPHAEDGSETGNPQDELIQTTLDTCQFLRTEPVMRGRRAFVKIADDFLSSGHWNKFPKTQVVLEIADVATPTSAFLKSCRKAMDAGYSLALGVSTSLDKPGPMAGLAEFLKVDVLSTPDTTLKALPGQFKGQGKFLVAENVENEKSFLYVQELGYDYFKGPFLSRPATLGLKMVPGIKLYYFRLIQELHKPSVDFDKIEAIVKNDMSLSFNLLRYLNSAAFHSQREITSIRQAISLLGERAIRKWVSLMAMSEIAADKPEELIIQAATRARLCEAMAPSVGLADRKEELFLMGMFSMLESILDCSLTVALNGLSIAADLKQALTGTPNKLSEVLDYILAYEDGNWQRVWSCAEKLAVNELLLPDLYLDSVAWVEQSLRGVQRSQASA